VDEMPSESGQESKMDHKEGGVVSACFLPLSIVDVGICQGISSK